MGVTFGGSPTGVKFGGSNLGGQTNTVIVVNTVKSKTITLFLFSSMNLVGFPSLFNFFITIVYISSLIMCVTGLDKSFSYVCRIS